MPYKDRAKQLEFQKVHQANKTFERRFIVLEFLGGECVECGESDKRCLQIDHIEPILRKPGDTRYGYKTVLDVYMDREATEKLQILCANCHCKKTGSIDKFKFSSWKS